MVCGSRDVHRCFSAFLGRAHRQIDLQCTHTTTAVCSYVSTYKIACFSRGREQLFFFIVCIRAHGVLEQNISDYKIMFIYLRIIRRNEVTRHQEEELHSAFISVFEHRGTKGRAVPGGSKCQQLIVARSTHEWIPSKRPTATYCCTRALNDTPPVQRHRVNTFTLLVVSRSWVVRTSRGVANSRGVSSTQPTPIHFCAAEVVYPTRKRQPAQSTKRAVKQTQTKRQGVDP